MNPQESLEIGRLILGFTATVETTGANLTDLLVRLFEMLDQIGTIRVRHAGTISLYDTHRRLVSVARFGLTRTFAEAGPGEIESLLCGLAPEGRAEPYILGLDGTGNYFPPEAGGRAIVVPLSEGYTSGRAIGVMILQIDPAWVPDAQEIGFLTDIGHAVSGFVARHQTHEALQVRELELEEARSEAIRRLGIASEYRDNETGMHIMRMSHFAAAVAKAMNLPENLRETLAITAPMHDLGKIGVSDTILLKPGRLTDAEFDQIKQHTRIGERILAGGDELTKAAREIAAYHHENWDGSGYPYGLKGEDIPILARVCAIADVFDALTSIRPYKDAWTIEEATDWIVSQSGIKFDPAVVTAFQAAMPNILRIGVLYRDDIINPTQLVELPEALPSSDRWLNWHDDLSVGIDVIDSHHRFLLDHINFVHEAVAEKRSVREIGRALRAMSQYAQVHFRAEERMMERYGYAGLPRQKEQHHRFERRLDGFNDELRASPLTARYSVLMYLQEWLVHHIIHEDAKLRELADRVRADPN